MKVCTKCKEEKNESDFYKRTTAIDGLSYYCKVCSYDAVTKYKETEKGRLSINLSSKKYNKTAKGKIVQKEAHSKYSKSEKCKLARKKYRKENPLKRTAANIVNNAIRAGKLKRSNCEICGSEKVHGHHDNYSFPLSVRWLCPVHHKQWHNENGSAING